MATGILASFRQVVRDRALQPHLVMARLLNPAVLERIQNTRLVANIVELGTHGREAGEMAYILRNDLRNPLWETKIEISEKYQNIIFEYFNKSLAHPGSIRRASWQTGTLLPFKIMPRRLKFIEGINMYDFLGLQGGGVLVSERFKDAVESIEPNTHQFFPVEIDFAGRTPLPGKFFIFNVVGQIEAIIEEKSNLKATGREYVHGWIYERKVGPWKCAVDASVVSHRAYWVERRYGHCWFVSDRFADLIRQNNLTGCDLDEYCEES